MALGDANRTEDEHVERCITGLIDRIGKIMSQRHTKPGRMVWFRKYYSTSETKFGKPWAPAGILRECSRKVNGHEKRHSLLTL